MARNHTEDGSILGTAHSSEMYRQNIGSHTHRKFLQHGLFSCDLERLKLMSKIFIGFDYSVDPSFLSRFRKVEAAPTSASCNSVFLAWLRYNLAAC
jgi:hypothetical protein